MFHRAIYPQLSQGLVACFVCVRRERMGIGSVFFVLAAFMAAIAVGVSIATNEAPLAYDYYKHSCPGLEDIVKKTVRRISLLDVTAPATFLRLIFHDCQVQGCDASILLDYDDSEITSSENFAVKNREKIQRIKDALEPVCPGQVSCADIVALAARESVSLSGGPHIEIPLGRKDSTTSTRHQADTHLPPAGISVDKLLPIFTSKGMNVEEAVAMMGAHTLGVVHCLNIVERLYDPQPGDNMNEAFRRVLKLTCPTRIPLTNLTFFPNDLSPFVFDNQYFRHIMRGKGLLPIDSSISIDPRTAPIVDHFAVDKNYFFQVFSSAFVKLSLTDVLTDAKGEVRRICNRVN